MVSLTSKAARILGRLAEEGAVAGGFVPASEFAPLFATEQECLDAQLELFRSGMLMLQATPSTRVCNAALTPSGVEAMKRILGK